MSFFLWEILGERELYESFTIYQIETTEISLK